MAIQLDLSNSEYGIPFVGAYFRISSIMINRQRDKPYKHGVIIYVSGYASIPQDEDVKNIDSRAYHVSLTDIESQTGDSFMSKCYVWVMAQPDMAGSIAV